MTWQSDWLFYFLDEAFEFAVYSAISYIFRPQEYSQFPTVKD
jgi:hypothetical protein